MSQNSSEYFRVYCCDWIYGFGQTLVITTSQQDINERNIIAAETFVLAFDNIDNSVKGFKSKAIKYEAMPEDKNLVNIDALYMEQEALRQAKNIIFGFQWDEYNRTQDKGYIDRGFMLKSCDKTELIRITGCEAQLKWIQSHTKSEQLKNYISVLLGQK